MKKIINEPTQVVSELLKGMELAHPELKYTENLEIISRREKKQDKVAVISGGGAGHEPAHAGYVGTGMLDAAVSGNVFSSPSPDRITEAISQVDAGKGVLMIIKNYSGDIMNFGMSKDLAELEDIEVDSVVVRDDVDRAHTGTDTCGGHGGPGRIVGLLPPAQLGGHPNRFHP